MYTSEYQNIYIKIAFELNKNKIQATKYKQTTKEKQTDKMETQNKQNIHTQ